MYFNCFDSTHPVCHFKTFVCEKVKIQIWTQLDIKNIWHLYIWWYIFSVCNMMKGNLFIQCIFSDSVMTVMIWSELITQIYQPHFLSILLRKRATPDRKPDIKAHQHIKQSVFVQFRWVSCHCGLHSTVVAEEILQHRRSTDPLFYSEPHP